MKQLTHTHVVARANYGRAFDVELAALDAGLALPRPVPHPTDGGPLGDLAADGTDEPVTVLVHRSVEGQPLDPNVTVSPAVARAVAQDLARLHGLGLDPGGLAERRRLGGTPTPPRGEPSPSASAGSELEGADGAGC